MEIRTNQAKICRIAILVLVWIVGWPDSRVQAERPNIVLLLADDLGWKDLGCYGGPVRTPTLDRLAGDGLRFTDFYSGAAVCSPSRAVLLTGRTNLRSGIYSWINDHDQRSHLPRSEVTLAELLKTQGYSTAHFGKWHLGMPSHKFPGKPTPADHGFDYWFATANNAQPSHRNPRNFVRNGAQVEQLKGYACDLVVDEAINWLDDRSEKDAPFFLNVWFHEPHAPLAAPANLVAEYGAQTDPAAVYSATIANTDRAIERLIQKVHAVDAPEETLIIYASDNGSYRRERVGQLRGTKGSNYEGGIRVPGIFYWPDHIAAGSVTSEPAGVVDLVPTICSLVDCEFPPVHLDGTDLSSLLTGKTSTLKRTQPLFWGLPLSGPAVAIRDGRYGMVAFREGRVPRDLEAIAAIKQQIERTLRNKGIFEQETRGSTFARQLFEGFKDREAENLRGQFIRLNQFHESWIPQLKKSKFTRFELYDLTKDVSQQQDVSLRVPQVHHRLKLNLERIASDALAEALDWTSNNLERETRIHRLASTFRSPFDAFLYVNRVPSKPESDESQDDLAGRILGRLANQEGRILIKLPPGMDRKSYQGFKIALDTGEGLHSGRCVMCHRLPNLGAADMDPPTPSLRNRASKPDQLPKILASQSHRDIQLDDQDLERLQSWLQALNDVPDKHFRNLILKASVLNTVGDPE